MEVFVYKTLKRIRNKHGYSEFGKILQKLLGVTLCRLSYELREHSVQDVDIEAVKNESKYWIEVKTTDKDKVVIKEKDINGLNQCKILHEGITGYAILKVGLLSEWIIASSGNIEQGSIRIGRFTANKILPIQNDINKIFPVVVKEIGNRILSAKKGQAQLVTDKLLKEEIDKKKNI